MWFYRVLFNVRARFLNQKSEDDLSDRSQASWAVNDAKKQVQLIENRLVDLDQRLSRLQNR
jgi:hypothetical protein